MRTPKYKIEYETVGSSVTDATVYRSVFPYIWQKVKEFNEVDNPDPLHHAMCYVREQKKLFEKTAKRKFTHICG